MRLFAISDLHLSYGVDKPMHVFGEHWRGHGERIRDAWDAMVGPEDTVLVGGDISWGLNLQQAQPDLDWLGERPGRKVLIKGNHCHWWSSRSKVEKVLHPSVTLLQNDCVRLADDSLVVGCRLWDPPDAPWADENAPKIFRREVERFRLSCQAAVKERDKQSAHRILALIHYPPLYADGRSTDVVPMMQELGVSVCIYGHLHTAKHHKLGFQGVSDGIRYALTAVDAIDFRPVEVLADGKVVAVPAPDGDCGDGSDAAAG